VTECVQQHVWRHDQHVSLGQHILPALPAPAGQVVVVGAAMVRARAEAVAATQRLVTLLRR
jgi:hypothetical protein